MYAHVLTTEKKEAMKILKQNVISLLLNHFSLWKIPLIFYAFLRLKALIMSLDLYWIKYFSWTETYFLGKKKPLNLKRKWKMCWNSFLIQEKTPPTCRVISPKAEQETKELGGNYWSLLGNTQYRKRPRYAYAFSYLHLVLFCEPPSEQRALVLKKLFWDTLTEADGI